MRRVREGMPAQSYQNRHGKRPNQLRPVRYMRIVRGRMQTSRNFPEARHLAQLKLNNISLCSQPRFPVCRAWQAPPQSMARKTGERGKRAVCRTTARRRQDRQDQLLRMPCEMRRSHARWTKTARSSGVKGNPEDPRSQGRMCGKGPRRAEDTLRSRSASAWSAAAQSRDAARRRAVGSHHLGRGAFEWLAATHRRNLTDKYGAEAVAYGQGTGRGTNQWTEPIVERRRRCEPFSLSPGNICLGTHDGTVHSAIRHVPHIRWRATSTIPTAS